MVNISQSNWLQGSIVSGVVAILLFGVWYTPSGYYRPSRTRPDFLFQNATLTHYKWADTEWEIHAKRAEWWALDQKLLATGIVLDWQKNTPKLQIKANTGVVYWQPFRVQLQIASGVVNVMEPMYIWADRFDSMGQLSIIDLKGQVKLMRGTMMIQAGALQFNRTEQRIVVTERPEMQVW